MQEEQNEARVNFPFVYTTKINKNISTIKDIQLKRKLEYSLKITIYYIFSQHSHQPAVAVVSGEAEEVAEVAVVVSVVVEAAGVAEVVLVVVEEVVDSVVVEAVEVVVVDAVLLAAEVDHEAGAEVAVSGVERQLLSSPIVTKVSLLPRERKMR